MNCRSEAVVPNCRFQFIYFLGPGQLFCIITVYIYILETLRSLRSRMFLARCARAGAQKNETAYKEG